MNKVLIVAAAAFIVAPRVHAQEPRPAPLPPDWSHHVNADSSITFRYKNAAAKSIKLALDIYVPAPAMTPGEDGVWTYTTPPLPPQFYGYDIVVDGQTILDPLNPDVRFNYVFLANQVLVPGTPPAPWELTNIPHGRTDHVIFTSHSAKNLPANQSGYVVYTPPGYDAKKPGGYPVLYLLHGWSDNETGWTQIGRANFILDTLIHERKAVPMIVVMTLGYGDLDFVQHGFGVWNDAAKIDANVTLYQDELLHEVMPAVDTAYNTARGRDNRAIIGLSMGGLESLTIGLRNTDTFAYVGGMSSAIHELKFDTLAHPNGPAPKLLWVACGTGDSLIEPNRKFVMWAKQNGLNPVAVETPGLHVWTVWRDNLIQFAPLLFHAGSK